MRDESKRNLRVGLLGIAGLALVALTILMVGNRRQLFIRHTDYTTSFQNVTGLETGSPVKLNGVTVGFIKYIELSADAEEQRIEVGFSLDSRYTERIREDSSASIRSMGLLGDRYIEITSGSPTSARINEGARVAGKDPAELSQFVATGEDLLQNLIAISSSMRIILARIEAGEGVLGELTTSPEAGDRLGETLTDAIVTLGDIFSRVDRGEGLLGRLIREDSGSGKLLDDLADTSRSLHRIATRVAIDLERPDTAYAALLRSPATGGQVVELVNNLQTAAAAIAAAAEELTTGEGTLPRLMRDREFADDFLGDLEGLVSALRSAADKLDRGEGTAGAFINDPQLYMDLEDVVRGTKESGVVSWFIRNRRKSGETARTKEETEATTTDGDPVPTGEPGR